jgi:hypothetical protein
MDNFLARLVNDLKEAKQGHIYYHYNDIDKYLQNAITFIVTVITYGSHVMLVENDRNILYIEENLKKQLTEEQLKNLHIINNFDFYYSNGDFHAETIFSYFKTNIEPLLNLNVSICTWGLIEWSDENDITSDIEQYEKDLDTFVNEKGLISVCAYDGNRTSQRLKDILMRCHRIMLTDDQYIYLDDHKAI